MFPPILYAALLLGQPADDPTAFLNQYFADHWRAERITPAERCGDHEFLRRASLDLIGRIPTVEEIATYMKDAPERRRALLIDRLLKHDDAPRHGANVWTQWLLGSAADDRARAEFHGWLQHHFTQNRSHKEMAEHLLLATGTTRDEPAGHFIVEQRGLAVPENYWKSQGKYDMFPLTGHVFRVLHGRRLQCVQCHDHPAGDELSPIHFHEMNLFFRQVDIVFHGAGKKAVAEIRDNPALSDPPALTIERRGTPRGAWPRFYGEMGARPGDKETRREVFAKRFLAHPDFARGYVNRMWAQLFGHGLCIHPAGDDVSSDNPVQHEKVLDRLAREFVKSGHDPKALLRWICLSDCYGLSSVANKTNAAPEREVAFARQQTRKLSKEQLVESVLTALRYPTDERPKIRRLWLPDLARRSPQPCSTCGECIEDDNDAGLGTLTWMGGASFEDALNRETGAIGLLLKRHDRPSPEGLQFLYMHTLSRPATARELKFFMNPATSRLGTRQLDTEALWRSYATDVMWALFNCGEFSLNH